MQFQKTPPLRNSKNFDFLTHSTKYQLTFRTKSIAEKLQKSSINSMCPNCGNILAFYQQIQGNKLVCFVCRKISIATFQRSAAY